MVLLKYLCYYINLKVHSHDLIWRACYCTCQNKTPISPWFWIDKALYINLKSIVKNHTQQQRYIWTYQKYELWFRQLKSKILYNCFAYRVMLTKIWWLCDMQMIGVMMHNPNIIESQIKTAAAKHITYPYIIKVYVNMRTLVTYYVMTIHVYKIHPRTSFSRGFPGKPSRFIIHSSKIQYKVYSNSLLSSNVCSEWTTDTIRI